MRCGSSNAIRQRARPHGVSGAPHRASGRHAVDATGDWSERVLLERAPDDYERDRTPQGVGSFDTHDEFVETEGGPH